MQPQDVARPRRRGVLRISARASVVLGLAIGAATGCSADDDVPPAVTSERDCFAAWNAPGNNANRVAVGGFEIASVSGFVQTPGLRPSSRADEAAGSEGCSYLFHTDHRYLTLSGTWEDEGLRWGTPPTISGSWSVQQGAVSIDNAEVASDGTLRERPPPSPPTEPPPSPGPLEPPPPAWIETKRGSFWLGYSSFCWHTGCADYARASCAAHRSYVPKLVLERGEIVKAHLGFTPRNVELVAVERSSAEPIDHRLIPTPDKVTWRVERAGPFALMAVARKGEGGDASYVACVRFR
jgi:hypothetical protein